MRQYLLEGFPRVYGQMESIKLIQDKKICYAAHRCFGRELRKTIANYGPHDWKWINHCADIQVSLGYSLNF